jgi:hypothetical protein
MPSEEIHAIHYRPDAGGQVAFAACRAIRGDLGDIRRAVKTGQIATLEGAYIDVRRSNPEEPKGEIKKIIEAKAEMRLPSPKEIALRLQTGPFVPFDQHNPDHIDYLVALDTLLALSTELTES